jgi:phage/plasmid-like protein (TIGR03299 family)
MFATIADRRYNRDNPIFDQGDTVAAWTKTAGLDYEVKRADAVFTAVDEQGQEHEGCHSDLDVLYRSDTRSPLSVVSRRYNIVQPRDVMGFFRSLVEESGYKLETAGTFGEGKRLWAMCNTNLTGEIVKNDPVGGYILLATSYDGSMSTVAKFTPIRVVCQNTLTMALRRSKGDRSGLHISIPHNSKFDPAKVKGSLAGAAEQFEEFKQIARDLTRVQMTADKVDAFLIELVAKTVPEEVKPEQIRAGRTYKSLQALFQGEAVGADLPGVSGTGWGLLNAASEFYDWKVQARSEDSRINSAWFGEGERSKQKALQMLTALI